MIKKWKSLATIVAIALLSTTLVQCKGQDESNVEVGMTEEVARDYSEESASSSGVEEEDDSKVVTNIYMSIETTSFDKSVSNLEDAVKKHGGYIENSSIGHNRYDGRESYRSGNFTARIPSENEEAFGDEAKKLGSVTNENTSKADITKSYRDTETKLKVLEVKEERILAIMEQATEIEDLIALEESLNETIYEKEKLKSEISSMDSQVSFSTININLLEVKRYSTEETPDTGLWKKILDAFKNSFYVFGAVIERMLIVAIYILPFAFIGAMAYLLIRKFINKRRKK